MAGADQLVFFLGGRDLEMETIAALLIEHIDSGRIHDKGLTWGAKISAYKDEIRVALRSGLRPVLIELDDDLNLGDEAVHVDHHGERAGKNVPTSLEQIFRLLGLPHEAWTREFDLVAANDRGWIPELRRIGATAQQIAEIRRRDRRAQWVTEAEEVEAEEAVRSAVRNEWIIVHLPHRHSSAVFDRLALEGHDEDNILVLSHERTDRTTLTEVNFSGDGRIVRRLDKKFPDGWSGGALPERGYWGHAAPVPPQFLRVPIGVEEPDLRLIAGDGRAPGATFSRFVLPFRYVLTDQTRQAEGPFYERVSFENDGPDEVFERWHYLNFETADILFDRAAWFHLAGWNDEPFRLDSWSASGKSVYLRATAPRLVLFEYGRTSDSGDVRQRTSNDDRADLLQTGFLLIDLQYVAPDEAALLAPEGAAVAAPTIDDLLALNELFRYWRVPYAAHQRQIVRSLHLSQAGDQLLNDDERPNAAARVDFNAVYHDLWSGLLKHPIHDKDMTLQLFPEEWFDRARDASLHPMHARRLKNDRYGWIAYHDNRAFVWSCAILRQGVGSLRAEYRRNEPIHQFGYWVKLLNVDNSKSFAGPVEADKTRKFERKWAKSRTEYRWEGGSPDSPYGADGTAYGFSTHSGVMLGPPWRDPPLARHFSGMYFDQTLLLLYLRVTTFRFSEELSTISGNARDAGLQSDVNVWGGEFNRLRRQFALFTNLYQFPLVSNQQQAIELYSAARRGFDINELFAEVQEEIGSTHEYFELQDARRQSELMTKLSWFGGIAAVIALAMTFLSLDLLDSRHKWSIGWPTPFISNGGWGVFVMTIVVWLAAALFAWCQLYPRLTRSRSQRRMRHARF